MSAELLAKKRLQAAQAKKKETVDAMAALLAEAGDGEMSVDQNAEYTAFEADVVKFNAQIAQAESLLSQTATASAAQANRFRTIGTAGGIEGKPTSTIGAVEDQWKKDPKLGFESHRDFLSSVITATRTGVRTPQLEYLAAAGSDEQNTQHDAYGGYFIPTGLAPGVKTVAIEADPTAGLVTAIPLTTPKLEINARVDKNHSTSVAGGVTVSRRSETQAASSSRMAFEQITLSTNGLFGLAYASEELLERSPISFAALLDQGFGEAYTAKVCAEKLSGTGAGQPQGILNAGCLISVAKEASQTADTINATNLLKMRERIWRYGSAIWLANHDCLRNLMACHIAGTNGDVFLFAPGNGTTVPDTLLGRPIYFTDHAKTIGDQGDIILANWSEYGWATYGPTTIQRAESMHVRFVEHERCFKFYVYNDGQPLWRTALTPPNSTVTRSPFVVLDARA